MNCLKYSLLLVIFCCSGAGYRNQYNQYNVYNNNMPAAYSYANMMFTPVVVQTTRETVSVVSSQPVLPSHQPQYYPYEYYSINNRPCYWVYVHGYGWVCRFY